MLAYFHRLNDQTLWANRRVAERLASLKVFDERALSLLAHIVSAEKIYLERISEIDPFPQDFWVKLSLEECTTLIEENHASYHQLFSELTDYTVLRAVSYRNSAGEKFRTSVCDLLTHIFQHGAYHRGQIALLLRASHATPSVTDYINFTRPT